MSRLTVLKPRSDRTPGENEITLVFPVDCTSEDAVIKNLNAQYGIRIENTERQLRVTLRVVESELSDNEFDIEPPFYTQDSCMPR